MNGKRAAKSDEVLLAAKASRRHLACDNCKRQPQAAQWAEADNDGCAQELQVPSLLCSVGDFLSVPRLESLLQALRHGGQLAGIT